MEDGGSWPGASMSPKISVPRGNNILYNNLITTDCHARKICPMKAQR